MLIIRMKLTFIINKWNKISTKQIYETKLKLTVNVKNEKSNFVVSIDDDGSFLSIMLIS